MGLIALAARGVSHRMDNRPDKGDFFLRRQVFNFGKRNACLNCMIFGIAVNDASTQVGNVFQQCLSNLGFDVHQYAPLTIPIQIQP